MDVLYELSGAAPGGVDRNIAFENVSRLFTKAVSERLWCAQLPRIERNRPGETAEFWGMVSLWEYSIDAANLLRCLQGLSKQLHGAEFRVQFYECPGFVLEGKAEIIAAGKFQRYGNELIPFLDEHPPVEQLWGFRVDRRIWGKLLEKTPEVSDHQILSFSLARGCRYAAKPRMAEGFFAFSVDYDGLRKEEKKLKVPASLAQTASSLAERHNVSKQELTLRSIYSSLVA